MMSRTLGAPLGGTMVGGHQGFESVAFSLITPPNFGAGAGSWFPLMVVVALGDPNLPVTTCAATGATASVAASKNAATSATTPIPVGFCVILCTPLIRSRCVLSSLIPRLDSAPPARQWSRYVGPVLQATRAFDIGDLLVDRRVVLAGRYLILRVLNPGENAEYGARGIDHRHAHGYLLHDVGLLALQHAEITLRSGAIDRHRLGRLLLALELRCAPCQAQGNTKTRSNGGPMDP